MGNIKARLSKIEKSSKVYLNYEKTIRELLDSLNSSALQKIRDGREADLNEIELSILREINRLDKLMQPLENCNGLSIDELSDIDLIRIIARGMENAFFA